MIHKILHEMMETRSLDAPEETRTFQKGKVQLVSFGGHHVGRATLNPGWRWSTCVKSIAGTETCQSRHYGYQIAGTMRTRLEDGTEMMTRAGDVLKIPPGHDSWVVGDEDVVIVDFLGLGYYSARKRRGISG